MSWVLNVGEVPAGQILEDPILRLWRKQDVVCEEGLLGFLS